MYTLSTIQSTRAFEFGFRLILKNISVIFKEHFGNFYINFFVHLSNFFVHW
jgi:hypothetical protein